ncbi:sugar-transfer associated ATP-grasp domain-containing protein [Flavivirga spongiicola]|uniref:Alpha-L-glutamate ligase-related protein ATP-grasp domain-containing protein n=1 Tax=Flavivirga spongiicola TaxID=421621 RepID=A0ABU7XSB3_9FLAO|nr:sugar-transfer associated ATP-grasp domain-containing protein [Flavivirga sp. MEBiC05379]MDO5978638.1 sugar-transfer associated ATP-grasp domain-containing protein [Flavivirga sp. MEBiC05379]
MKIIKELLILTIKKREIPYYYFKFLYSKDVKNYLDYLSTKEVVAIGSSSMLHKPEYKSLFDNKLFFALFCEKSSIRTPKLISYNLGSSFYFNNKNEKICSKKELVLFFEKMFTLLNIEGLFFRPPSDYGGKGCFKLTRKTLVVEINKRYESIVNGCFVHTEIINQHTEINKIHSKSVNTIRMISFITPEDEIEIICAFMRFGVGNSPVDNASSGGFCVGINLNEGTLKPSGFFMLEYGGGKVQEHPDSGFKLDGFKIPYFKEACEEVIKAVKIIPNRFIGWDVAITQNGTTIVEANWDPHIFLSGYAYGGLLKNKHIRNLVKELKTKEK